MLAHESNRFSGKKVVLPSKFDVSEEIVFRSGVNSLLAHCWGEVDDASEHLRFFGGEISERRALFRSPEDGTVIEADVVRFELDFALQQWEIVARKRLAQASFQSFMNLRGYGELQSRIRNIHNGPLEPAPDSFVSEHEAQTIMLLEMAHHISQQELSRVFDGLTLVEWVRCYCTLRCYANPDGLNPTLDLIELNLAEFRKALERGGVSSDRAEHFVESVIFQRGMRDLYDAPILADADGRHWFLAPLFANANVAEIVLSQLGSRHASFDSKGSAFEKTIRDAFQKHNIPARGFNLNPA